MNFINQLCTQRTIFSYIGKSMNFSLHRTSSYGLCSEIQSLQTKSTPRYTLGAFFLFFSFISLVSFSQEC